MFIEIVEEDGADKQLHLHEAVPIPPSKCANCKTELGFTTGLQVSEPHEGDFSICSNCGFLLVFNADHSLRAADEAELDDFKENSPELWRITQLISRKCRAMQMAREN